MKKNFLLITLIIISVNIEANKPPPEIPPGTVRVGENIYFDTGEIRNHDYREYLYWLRIFQDDTDKYYSALPDTTVWQTSDTSLNPLVLLYLRHPDFQLYPVVGVSYRQAVEYCNWRSDRVNELKYMKDNDIRHYYPIDMEIVTEVYKYRLPSKKEWEQVANVGYSKKTERKMNRRKYINQNRHNFASQPHTYELENSEKYYSIDITAPAKSHFPNELGIYNLFGNVAEMVAEEGIAKGGSFIHNAEDVDVEKDFFYDAPVKWLGFRCVCEISQ